MTKEECDLKFEMLEIRSDIERCLNKHNIEASSKNISNMASVMLDQVDEGNIYINAEEAFHILYPNHNKENKLSVAGRVDIAMALLEEGYITMPEKYFEVLNAGIDITDTKGLIFPRKGHQAPVCNHSWKPYMGFTENYNYCEHCGVKEHES